MSDQQAPSEKYKLIERRIRECLDAMATASSSERETLYAHMSELSHQLGLEIKHTSEVTVDHGTPQEANYPSSIRLTHPLASADELTESLPHVEETVWIDPDPGDVTDTLALDSSDQLHAEPRGQLGDYEIIAEIARGGMGVVYKARQISLNRIVAIKKVIAGRLASEQDVQRFRIEAEASAKLDHPGIVPVYDFGERDGLHYFSMGYVEGKSLADRIHEGPLEPRAAAELLVKISRAVAYANARGVIHRDLKPGNVLLDRAGEPRVTDFGLAKQQADDSGMTTTGQILGTPSYMPPEQALGNADDVDQRADVYALGAILYATLTGRPPFQAAKTMETLKQVTEAEPVAVRQLVPATPRDLETICSKCLYKRADRRYESGDDLADDLQRWLDGEPIMARRVSRVERTWKWCRRRPVLIGAVAIVLVAAVTASLIVYSNKRANDRQRMNTVLDSLETANGEAVPFALAALDGYPKSWVVEELDRRFRSAEVQAELNLAYGLSHYDQPDYDAIMSGLIAPDTSSDEVMNIVDAMLPAKDEFVDLLITAADEATLDQAWTTKTRIATIALYLREPSIAAEMLRIESDEEATLEFDPVERTEFINEFAAWSGDPTILAGSIRDTAISHLRSGFALALGGIDRPGTEAKAAWKPVLRDWFANALDSGTHSASGWALRRWELELPELTSELEPSPGRNWWRTSDLTLIKIPSGSVAGESGPIVVENDFWLSDCEINVGLFQQFMEDDDYQGLKPENWEGARLFHGDASPDLPVQQVSWFDAVMFCNWLSQKLGLEPAYKIEEIGVSDRNEKFKVELLPSGGVRLPTEAEWKYGCRAATTTDFAFGDALADLSGYGWFYGNSDSRTHRVGKKRCNAWGLFDMHGNVEEWCWDSGASFRAYRGGSWYGSAGDCQSTDVFGDDPSYRNLCLGFRVALGPLNSQTTSGAESEGQ